MAVKLLLSRPAGGKTSFCIDEIRKVRMKDPMAPVKVIVPDRMQMAYWKQELARGSRTGGFIGTEVISFSKLAMEILDTAPGSPVLIPSRLNSLCIRDAVMAAARKVSLAYFEPIREKPGTLAVFEQTIQTLLHEHITPEMLEKAAEGDPKTSDTARVYREYLGLMMKNNWTGAAGLPGIAADAMEQGRGTFPRCPLLVVDGFNELAKDCRDLLRTLSPFCDEILITLPADPDSDHPTDRRIRKHADVLCSELDAGIISPLKSKELSGILQLTDRVFYPGQNTESGGTAPGSGFLMIEASSRTTEVREALRELKRRILTEHLRAADCAVFVPDMNAYASILRQFGREMGIPLRFSRRQKLSESPAASALKRLLHLAPDFETLKVLSVLRLPFFSGCPDPKDDTGGNYGADLYVIDRIGRNMNVISGIGEWRSAFAEILENAPDSLKPESDAEDPDDGRVYEYPERKKLERIRDSFLKFAGLLTPPAGQISRAEWVKWLEDLLETIRFYEQIRDRNGRSFEADLRALLKRIVFCEDRLDQPAVFYAEFLSELEAELDDAEQTEPEFIADRILVGDISQTSGCRWKLIVLAGFAEGIFPRAGHEDLILTNALREKLGIPPETDQQLLFRHAVTRSDTGLVITRPQKTDKGEEWPASIFWLTLRENLPDGGDLLTVTENMPVAAASLNEFAFRLAKDGQNKIPAAVPQGESEKLRDLLDAAWNEMEIMREQTQGIYSPDPDPALKAALADPMKDAVPYSCSAIETWLTCPFRYYLSRKLGLEQPQEPGKGMDAAQIGSLNHKVMELTFPPGTVYSSKDEALKKADKMIDRVFATAPQDFGFRESELWEYEKEKYRQKLLDSIEKMFDAEKTKMPVDERWRSAGAEMRFGYPKKGRENTEPLTVETTAGSIRIRGVIDRVDQRNDGLLRVVDYKTGASGFSKGEIAAGSHIQAGVYAAAVVHALRMGPKCEGMYWSINNKQVKEYMVYDSENDEEFPNISFLNKFAEGIRDAAFPAEPAGGTCPDYCPAAPWCRKYARREFYG